MYLIKCNILFALFMLLICVTFKCQIEYSSNRDKQAYDNSFLSKEIMDSLKQERNKK